MQRNISEVERGGVEEFGASDRIVVAEAEFSEEKCQEVGKPVRSGEISRESETGARPLGRAAVRATIESVGAKKL